MKQDFFENEYVEYWKENGIVIQNFKPGLININITIARKIVQDRFRITNDTKMPLFVDTNNGRSMDRESRIYFASEESLSDLRAIALVVHNPFSYLAAKLFLIMNKPKMKIEFFKEKDKAFMWLEKYKG